MIFLFAATLLAGLAMAFGYYFVFSRPMSLDEGYVMITLKGFSAGHPLYDSVFTQYGPFYYWYEWLVRTAARIPLTHDSARLLCVAHWLIGASLLGAAAWRITRSKLLGLFVAAQAVAHLSAVAHEPGHPQEIVVVLLAAAMLVACFSQYRWSFVALGVIAAALAFTKINVGIFFGFALLLAFGCGAGLPLFRGKWRWLVLLACAALPAFLMRKHLDGAWCRNLAIILSATVAGSMCVAPAVAADVGIKLRRVAAAALGFGALALALVIATLADGTSASGLFAGLITTPLKMVGVALLTFDSNALAPVGALLALAGASAWLKFRQHDRAPEALALAKLLYAVAALCLVGDARDQLQYLLPWIWLVLVPAGGRKWAAHETFARLFACFCGAWQPLQAYPIAGTQVTLGTLPLVLVCAVCMSDALCWLAQQPSIASRISALPASARLPISILASVAVLYLFANVWCSLPSVRREYAGLPELNLPGSRRVHIDAETATQYQALTEYLARECDTFITYPGVNSLYFWTGKEPPTQVNCTGWGQLSLAQQEYVLSSIGKAARPKIVVVEAATQAWQDPMYNPIRPLVRYVTEQCIPLKRIGRFIVFEPKRAEGAR